MSVRTCLAGALACLAVAACSDAPTTPNDVAAPSPAVTGKPTLNNGVAVPVTLPVTSTANGARGAFKGTVTITQFALNSANQLVASGTIVGQTRLNGVATPVNTSFTNALVTDPPNRCSILHLDLGPIFLDVLGLQLQTNEIVVDLSAVPGAGNLLGNLLCSLFGLLDQSPLNLSLINQILAQLNAILAGL